MYVRGGRFRVIEQHILIRAGAQSSQVELFSQRVEAMRGICLDLVAPLCFISPPCITEARVLLFIYYLFFCFKDEKIKGIYVDSSCPFYIISIFFFILISLYYRRKLFFSF